MLVQVLRSVVSLEHMAVSPYAMLATAGVDQGISSQDHNDTASVSSSLLIGAQNVHSLG